MIEAGRMVDSRSDVVWPHEQGVTVVQQCSPLKQIIEAIKVKPAGDEDVGEGGKLRVGVICRHQCELRKHGGNGATFQEVMRTAQHLRVDSLGIGLQQADILEVLGSGKLVDGFDRHLLCRIMVGSR